MLKDKLKLTIRYWEKFCLHRIALPIIYRYYCRLPVQETLVLFADAKNTNIPFSMKAMYSEMKQQGYQVENWCSNFDELSVKKKLQYLKQFMKRYAQAKYVFICDYFLPVSSCNKRKETKVVQLWHSCGLLKKFGYDASDDLGSLKGLYLTKNIDLWPVSADACVSVFEKATHLYDGQIQALGVSRTDIYFSEEYRKNCVEKFYELYPELKGRKLILWAPTFRGNAKAAELVGSENIKALQDELGNEWKVLIKVHPHLAKRYQLDNCELPTEELYPVIDLLITDYSSVVFDYSLFEKPFLIFAPDYDVYMKKRGCYIDMEKEMPCGVVKNYVQLKKMLDEYETLKQLFVNNKELLKAKHLNQCSGSVAEILNKKIKSL